MKLLAFARRNTKEILRDPLTLIFGIGFPVILLLLLTLINKNIPQGYGPKNFALDQLTPGVSVFGLSFLALFAAMLLSKDRCSSLLQRLYTTPLREGEFILGYLLPLLPMALLQSLVCYLVAFVLGLHVTCSAFLAILANLPAALLYISIGLLCGSVMNDKQVGGICGALLTNLSAWLSGTWFSLDLVGGVFKKIAYCLPFAHAVDLGRAVLAGTGDVWPQLAVVLAYALGFTLLAILFFLRQRKKN